MELDFTAQLQPALWGLVIALVTAATALATSIDRSEIDLPVGNRFMSEWQRRWRRARASWERGLARIANAARYLVHQLPLRERRKV